MPKGDRFVAVRLHLKVLKIQYNFIVIKSIHYTKEAPAVTPCGIVAGVPPLGLAQVDANAQLAQEE